VYAKASESQLRESGARYAVSVLSVPLLKSKRVAIDATTLEANAAMRSIVHRDTGESYEEFLAGLAQGGYIDRAEPVILIGDCGTGKTHLLTGLCVAACRQKRRVRFATASALVNELVEAKQQLQLQRVLARWERYDLIAIDEVGYVPMADLGAEFLFQVIAGRAEKAAVILTTNLPFSFGDTRTGRQLRLN
jgi:DNA replication protein DnaC